MLKKTFFVNARKLWQQDCELFRAEKVMKNTRITLKMAKVRLGHAVEDVPFSVCFLSDCFVTMTNVLLEC